MSKSPLTSERPKPIVVHVTGDFPDPVERFKTSVIRSLLDLTRAKFAHHVLSLNRVAPTLRESLRPASIIRRSHPFADGEAIEYAAPARGVLHATMLKRLGDALAERLADQRPALLVGHKLTIEGLVVQRAAQRLGVPFALSIQGNTDLKILAARPDLRGQLRTVYHQASAVFPFTPWAKQAVERKLGVRVGHCQLLPCPTVLDTAREPQPGGNGFVSVFHLQHHRNKNLAGLMRSYRDLRSRGIDTALTLVGGGDAKAEAACHAIAGDAPGVHLAGACSHADLPARLNQATGFVLPSFRESFGLVFIEALFAGLPIIYPRGAAVDGYFDGMPFAIAVDVRDEVALTDAMEHVVCEEGALKEALREWQNSRHARQFTREAIGAQFRDGLHQALAAHRGAGHSEP